MRILFISLYDPFEISGPGIHLRRLSRSLSNLGCKVHILTRGASNSTYQSDGVSIHYNKTLLPWALDFGQGFAFCMSIAQKIDKFCKTNRIDIVHGQSPSSFAYALLHGRKFPLAVTMHGTSFGEISSNLNRSLSLSTLAFDSDAFFNQPLWAFLTFLEYRLADRLIAVSNATAKEAELFYRIPEEKVVVIPNGVDIARLPEGSTEEAPEFILSVGRLVWRKGFHYLINAMPRILASFPNTNLYIVGEGPEKDRLYKQVKKLGIKESVHILQKVPRSTLDSLFLRSTVYVQPSLYEPFAMTVLEAMSFGKAIVATKVGGLQELIRDRINGLLVEPGNSNQLSETIMRLLSDQTLRENLSKEGMSRIEREFSWNIIAKQTVNTYEDLLKNFSYRSNGFLQKFLNDNFAYVFLRGESLLRWKLFQRFLNFTKEDVVADLGGGSGGWTKRVAPLVKNVVLVDAEAKRGHYENSIHIAKREIPFKNVDFLVADVNSLPLRSGCIHKALMNQVLEHIDRPSDAFRETSRVLGENGIFVTSTPNVPFLKRYKFPITELIRKIFPRNLRHANNRFLIGAFVKNGYNDWMKETGHVTLGFSLSQIQDMGKSAGLICNDHDYLHKGICVWLWELGYCLPFASFALRPLSMLLYAFEHKSSDDGLDIICRLEKIKEKTRTRT